MPENALQALRRVVGNIDIDFGHGPRGERMQTRRFGARAEHFELVSGQMTQPTLGHLASGRVVGAEEKDAGFADHRVCCCSADASRLPTA